MTVYEILVISKDSGTMNFKHCQNRESNRVEEKISNYKNIYDKQN